MTWIKICGITNIPDALEASSLGVDALGFIFAPSPRNVTSAVVEEIVREVIRSFPRGPLKVGVFVNEDIEEVRRCAEKCSLDALQFHGRESPEYCSQLSLPQIKAIGVKDPGSLREMDRYPFASILLDTFAPERAGGTGKSFRWELALEARKKRNFILSGGLNPGNVNQAIHLLRPLGVDVCSGVELSPGKKDRSQMAEFIKEVKRADESTRS